MLLLRQRRKPAVGTFSVRYHVRNGELLPALMSYSNRGVYHFLGSDVLRGIDHGLDFDLYDFSFSVVLTLQSLSDA